MTDETKDTGLLGALHWFHWAVIVLSLGLTFSAWYFTKQQVDDKVASQFNREAEQVVELVKERMSKYEQALWAGVAAIHSQSRAVNHQEWLRFSQMLNIEERFPGINGIGVIHYVPPERLEAFLAEQRETRPEFKIHPQHDNPEYWPITYIEPVNINAKAVGLDMAHETNRFTAAKKARDTGTAQITGPIVLVQDAEKTPGFLFFTPYYHEGKHATLEARQKHFIGLVYAPFIMKKLMEGALKREKRHVGVSIHDGETLLYDEHLLSDKDFDANPLFKRSFTVDMYGRSWEFDVRSALSFRAANTNNQPVMILIAGLVIDSLLLGLFIVLSRSKSQAQELAAHKIQALEKSETTHQAYLDASGDGYWDWYIQDDYEYMSPRFWEMFGYEPGEKEHHPGEWQKIIFEDDLKIALDNFNKHIKTKGKHPFSQQVRYKHKNGSTVFVLCKGKVIEWDEDGKPVRMIGTHTNITDRENLIEQLADSNTELERFAYVASHDMQEPLRMVNNFSEILADEYKDKLDEKGKEYLKFVTDSAKRMREMVNDLLEYSRLGHETIRFTAFNGNEVLENVLDNLKTIIDKSNAKVTHDKLPELQGNPIQFMRLLQNLISNGIKYQPEGQVPEIHIGVEEEPEHWRILVRDNGLGIQKSFLKQVFEPFRRLQQYNEIEGTGLGLSVCRKIVESHGGEISVKSTPGEGSTFSFTLAKNLTEQMEAA